MFAIRPSGTEPKLKMYCSLVEKDETAAKKKFAAIRKNFERAFDLYLQGLRYDLGASFQEYLADLIPRL